MSRYAVPADLLVEVLGTVLPERSAYYCSGPITSGRRYVEWLARNRREPSTVGEPLAGRTGSLDKDVVDANTADLRAFSCALRRRVSDPVIDPAALSKVPGWTQHDYRAFWTYVIRRFVHTTVFVQGWNYSTGCAAEFVECVLSGVKVVDHELRSLSVTDGVAALEAGATYLRSVSVPDSEFVAILARLAGEGRRLGGAT